MHQMVAHMAASCLIPKLGKRSSFFNDTEHTISSQRGEQFSLADHVSSLIYANQITSIQLLTKNFVQENNFYLQIMNLCFV